MLDEIHFGKILPRVGKMGKAVTAINGEVHDIAVAQAPVHAERAAWFCPKAERNRLLRSEIKDLLSVATAASGGW